MSHARDIAKEPPDCIYVVQGPESYRIYWSTSHVANWVEKQKAAGITSKVIEYVAGKEVVLNGVKI